MVKSSLQLGCGHLLAEPGLPVSPPCSVLLWTLVRGTSLLGHGPVALVSVESSLEMQTLRHSPRPADLGLHFQRGQSSLRSTGVASGGAASAGMATWLLQARQLPGLAVLRVS